MDVQPAQQEVTMSEVMEQMRDIAAGQVCDIAALRAMNRRLTKERDQLREQVAALGGTPPSTPPSANGDADATALARAVHTDHVH